MRIYKYVSPLSTIQAVDLLLTKAREELHITNHAEILESVRTDLELIRYVLRLLFFNFVTSIYTQFVVA